MALQNLSHIVVNKSEKRSLLIWSRMTIEMCEKEKFSKKRVDLGKYIWLNKKMRDNYVNLSSELKLYIAN